MSSSLALVQDLGIALSMAAGMGLLAKRLGQPPVLGYLLAGLLVGPYIPIPVFADGERTHALSELGIVLVMFVVGLELRIKRLIKVLPTAGATALIEVGALLLAGIGIGTVLGWGAQGALFLGASIAISSTMIVSNVFTGQGVTGPLRSYVMSVLVVQDVLAIVLAAVLTAVAAGQGLEPLALAVVVVRLAAVLLGILALGVFLVPPLIRWVKALGSKELLVVVCAGLCFGLAFVAESLGYSVALGAFLAGVLVAESGEGHHVERAMEPVRDIFAAIFFVAIGMSVDPRLAFANLPVALVVSGLVLVVQLLSVGSAGILSGNGLRRSVRAGLSLGQVGEFGFILSAIGIQAGVAPPELAPIVVTVAVLTSFTTPIAIRHSEGLVHQLEDALPQRIRGSLSLYAAWLERLRSQPALPPKRSPGQRLLWVLALDGGLSVALGLGVHRARPWLSTQLERVGVSPGQSVWVLLALTLLLGLPLILGFARGSGRYAEHLAQRVLPDSQSQGRVLLQRGVRTLLVLCFGVPVAALLVPATGLLSGVVVLVLVGVLAMWTLRATEGADAELRSGAGRVLDILEARLSEESSAGGSLPVAPGLVEGTRTLTLLPHARGAGLTLAQLDLRAKTGATVVGVRSPGTQTQAPDSHQALQAGDVLVLAGPYQALQDAEQLLLAGPASP